ncbi:Metallo-dependent phosphatase-like protein, partial [Catenaria anguillulae PL171]
DSKPFNMTLIHTNDLHARFDQFSRSGIDCTAADIANKTCYGGIARIKTITDKIRATEPNVYMLDAGDQFQGTMFYSYYKGNITAEFMNAFGYDAFSIGNHEFDDGPAHLAKFLRKLHVPALSSNIDTAAEPAMIGLVAPYVVLTKYNAKIGIVGYITQTTPDITATGPNLRFSDPIAPVQRAVDELHKLGVNRIICVSHNGYLDDQRVARGTKGVSLIVGGHSHSLLHNDNVTFPQAAGPYPTAVKNLDGETTYIVQAKMWGEWVGHISMGWDANNKLTHLNGEPIRMTMDIAQHKETQDIVNKWREPFDAMTKVVIGNSPVALPNGAPCKTRGCGLGYLMAESLRQSYTGSLGKDKTVIGFIQDGGLRAGLPQGAVTVGNVLSIQPFSNSQVEMPINGTALVDMLENCAAGTHKFNGRAVTAFCQYSGVRATADRSKPVFQRVSNVQIRDNNGNWAPVDPNTEYAMVCSDFIATGGDNIVPEVNRKLLVRQLLSDVLLDYVKKIKAVVVPDEVGFQLIN